MDTNLIREIEDRAARAWPPEIEQALDGWRLRYTQGVTRRGNSVYPNHLDGSLPLETRLEKAEAFYARQGAPTHYQICPAALPTDLDHALEQRGYTSSAFTAVHTVSLPHALANTDIGENQRFSLKENQRFFHQTDFQLEILDDQSETWFTAYGQAEGFDEHSAAVRRATIRRIAQPKALVLAKDAGNSAAIGLGVYDSGWVGIFCMVTLPDYRRRGAATAVLHAIAAWGGEQGAHDLYLQVMENNVPALGLYAKAGFEKLYGYHYRTRA
jgi:ribosomal protein S18 acetylase RimI-like enzyme